MNFWSGLSQPCIFYSTLNANAEIWSNFAHSRLHSLCHSAAEFGTVAYVILLEGKRLQASASPAGRVWLCRENEDNKHKLCIIFPLSLFNLHSCTLLYCTVIQFWLQPQISLMSKKLLSFIFMKGPCTFLFFFFFFSVQLFWSCRFWFGKRKRNWLRWVRSVERRKTMLVSIWATHKRPKEWSDPFLFLFPPLSHLPSVSLCLLLPTACSFLICNSDFLA